MDGTDARELMSSALDKIENAIERADRDARLLVIDVRLWPVPLITVVVRVLRQRGRLVRKATTKDATGRIAPAVEIRFPLRQREMCFE